MSATNQLSLFKHGQSQTSLEAYKAISESGRKETLRERVLNAVKEHPFITRSEISLLYGIRLSSVCGRVNELLIKNAIYEDGLKKDKQTGMNVATLRAA